MCEYQIVSGSKDGTLYAWKPNNKPEQNKVIDLKEFYEITCFYPVSAWDNLEFVIGFGIGKVVYYGQ